MRIMISEQRSQTTEYGSQNTDYRTQRTDTITKAISGQGFSEGISTISAQLSIQFIGVAATASYTAVATFVILKAVNAITALRVCRECEVEGLDVYGHGEQGYIL